MYLITGPSPPTSLSAQPASPTSIRISWTPPASGATVVGYRNKLMSLRYRESEATQMQPHKADES